MNHELKIKNIRKIPRNGGAAMMMLVIFFVFISLTILIGIITPVTREFQIASTNFNSKQSYFLAESGVEDAFYRIRNNKKISGNETIVLGSNSATTTITTIDSGQKQIDSIGSTLNNQRKVTLLLKTGDGVVFHYGSQAGQGGAVLSNNARINGSFYSNGSILGSNNAYITGDAYAANGPSLTADQSNTSPTVPTNNTIFGNSNNSQDIGQSFQISSSGLINKTQFYIKKVGNPSDATVRITTNNAGSPSSTTIAQGTLNANLITTNYGWIDVSMSSNPEILNGVTYWVVIDKSTDVNNYYIIGSNNAYINGGAKIGQYSGTWNNTNPSGLDVYFNIFLGGLISQIHNVDIGQNGIGNAYANTITDSTVAGTLYCKTGSNNHGKSCNTSRADPSQIDLPISDANISQWQSDASAGPTINGNYTVSSAQSMGLKKIIGNLTINAKLTLTNTIWVTGNIIVNNTIKLDSSYGTTSGVIVADGKITINNGVTLEDSGQAGSYIMLLSTSNCDKDIVDNSCGTGDFGDAIEAQNNSSILIVASPHGAIHFSNNAGAKEIVANKVRIDNNGSITYGSGIVNVDFSSGPLGAWVLSGWKETQ